jgi:hypothetical protein
VTAPATLPRLVFSTPRALPKPADVPGRVAVLDIAFSSDGMGTPFAQVTQPFIDGLGSRLACWVDHHDHELHERFAGDARFVLATKAQHGACPEMVTPELVAAVGPIDSIVTHVDLDGLYAAAKWIRGGSEPYPGADDDARAVDTRIGAPGPLGKLIDHALRARFRDEALKHRVVQFLVGGAKDKTHRAVIAEAAAEFERMAAETERLTRHFQLIGDGRIAYCDARDSRAPYDKTELLLAGQELAPVSVVHSSGNVSIAAAFDSGWNFVELLGLGGGMPTRVSLPESRWAAALELIKAAPAP